MGPIGRSGRRRVRDVIRLKHQIDSTHRLRTPRLSRIGLTRYSLNLKRNVSLNADNERSSGGKMYVDDATYMLVKQEVMKLLKSSPDRGCTALSTINALRQSRECIDSHSKIQCEHITFSKNGFIQASLAQNEMIVGTGNDPYPKSSKDRRVRGKELVSLPFSSLKFRRSEKESMVLRYEWMDALSRLEKRPSTRDKVISSWEEAREFLEEIFCFPPCREVYDLREENELLSRRTSEQEGFGTDIKNLHESISMLNVSSPKWKQISSYPDHKRLSIKLDDSSQEEDIENIDQLIQRECVSKADLFFNAELNSATALDEALRKKNDSVKRLEERREAIEAQKRTSSLLKPLSDGDLKIVKEAIFGSGDADEVIAQTGTDSVKRASMKTLTPGMWLNDEIIHYFFLMLAKRDEELCKNDPSRKRSHFFKSFFITKLLNEGNASCDGKYEYRNVKRWSKKVPGKDIFKLDKILFPINMGNMHWICAAIYMTEKRIQIFDSMGSSGTGYLDALFKYIKDEHMDKKKIPLPNAEAWELVPTQNETPRQRNGNDCGVFTCMFADFVSKDTALLFNQEHINQCRERIALSIMKGKAIM